jgi:hypothetical protein
MALCLIYALSPAVRGRRVKASQSEWTPNRLGEGAKSQACMTLPLSLTLRYLDFYPTACSVQLN